MARAAIIIPARFDSTRFPGKVLANRTGRPLIQHVYERAALASCAEHVVVATDDERIRSAVEGFGGRVVMTRHDHPNGTSRVAEAARTLESALIVNVQGDEPEIDPDLIDRAVAALAGAPGCPMSTLAVPFSPGEDPADPNIVKVVLDAAGNALYFSRSLIPHGGESPAPASSPPKGGPPGQTPAGILKHLGLYVYRRPFLDRYVDLTPTPLEKTERLEQLRVLEHGHRIRVAVGETSFAGIDTPEEYEAFVVREQNRRA